MSFCIGYWNKTLKLYLQMNILSSSLTRAQVCDPYILGATLSEMLKTILENLNFGCLQYD